MTKLRYIKASSIQIHDAIRVTSRFEDTKTMIEGVVHECMQVNRSTFYYTEKGVELLAVHGDGTQTRGESYVSRITLLDRNPDLTLF